MSTDSAIRYRLADARRLLPLVQAIAREIRDRSNARRRLQRASLEGRFGERAARAVHSRLTDHEEGLERATSELTALGLTVLRTAPLTVHFPGLTGAGEIVFCWQEGDADIEHGHEPGAEDHPRRPLRVRARAPSRAARSEPESKRRTG